LEVFAISEVAMRREFVSSRENEFIFKINWNCNPAHPPELHQTACLTNLVEAPGKKYFVLLQLIFSATTEI
jgi:hypothetical protein